MRVPIAVALLLTGCAADQLRLDRTGGFANQAKTTVSAARAFITGMQARRREAAVALVASDPSCRWGPVIVIDSFRFRASSAAPKTGKDKHTA
jgi:hypothetical protein